MRRKFPIKNQYLLAGAVVLLLFVGYRFAFKNTIIAWQMRSDLQAQLNRAADTRYQPGYLARKNRNLSNVVRQYQADTTGFRSNSINDIALMAEKQNAKLTEVPTPEPFYRSNELIIQKLGFEGDFFALTKLLRQLETTPGIGAVRSATYRAIGLHGNTDEQKKLILEVYIEIAK